MLGPVFVREAVTAPRRPALYLMRGIYVAGLLLVMCTAWLMLTGGAQVVRNLGDMARFSAILFQILAALQLAIAISFSAFVAASMVAHEKDRRTIILLLLTELSDSELVLGKLGASLLHVGSMLLAGLPVLALTTLWGGVGWDQIVRVLLIVAATSLAAGSLGTMIALWRDKTFQTLALTAVVIALWLGIGEGLYAIPGTQAWSAVISPWRAMLNAAQPAATTAGASSGELVQIWLAPIAPFLGFATLATLLLNGISILGLRVWNPTREENRQTDSEDEAPVSIFGAEYDQKAASEVASDAARAGHVDSRLRAATERGPSREVWDQPILWRETQTWSHGTKILYIRLAFYVLTIFSAVAVSWALTADASRHSIGGLAGLVPPAAKALAPLMLLSLVLVNALSVTSITGERDGMTLDLVLATDVSPREFVFGKLGGVFWTAADMILLPLMLLGYIWFRSGIELESALYVTGGFLVLLAFVSMLGLHCGTAYSQSRTAIGVSLGIVFFLFLGIAICMLLMVSFSGSFQGQMAPFAAFIIGGGVGLYVSLGWRNPSGAIVAASIILPLATFYAITSFLLKHTLGVFLVTAGAYGFTTAAMLIPALDEFDVAMGRTSHAEED